MAKLTKTEIQNIIDTTKDLSNADLRYADLSNADLRYADLSNADLSNADLSYANLRYANLRYANLRYANLRFAYLSYADLRYVTGNRKEIKNINTSLYPIVWHSSNNKDPIIFIGCERYKLSEWLAFNKEEIKLMSSSTEKICFKEWEVIKQLLITMIYKDKAN